MSTTERVLDILVNEGNYRPLPRPFKVGSMPFEFTHALVAGEKANDIVIVIELKGDTVDDSVTRKIMALTRALDVIRSKRPVTAVLTSGQPRAETVQSISKVCRVIPVGAPTGPEANRAVRDWLSVLLPLNHQSAFEALLDWESDLRKAMGVIPKSRFVDNLIEAAPRGKIAVESVLARKISNLSDASISTKKGPEA